MTALQRSVVDDSAFGDVLQLIAERFRCPAAALVYVDEGQPAATCEIGHGLIDEAARARYHQNYAKDDPAPAAMARLVVGEVTTTGHLFGVDNPEHERFLYEFYYPMGLREAMGGPVVKGSGRFGVIAVQRGPDRAAFADHEVAEFAQLIPLVASTLELRRKFFELETNVSELQSVFEGVPVATMLFDARGRLRRANRAAREFLERQDGLFLTGTGRLKLADRTADSCLRALLSTKPAVDPAFLRVPRSKKSASAYILKAARPTNGSTGWTIEICDPSRTGAGPQDVLVVAFNLPPASARLTAALLNGETIDGYCARTGLARNTVKYHLKTAFAATETNRQSDLVRLASAIVRDLGS